MKSTQVTQSSNFPTGGLVVLVGGTEYLFIVKISNYAKKRHPEDSCKAIKRANPKHVSTEKDSKQGANAALCLGRWIFLKISQISQENTCVGVSF